MSDKRLRRSQIISPFGPGAIIDLVGESFVAEDAGRWPSRADEVDFRRLANLLRVGALQTPRAGAELPYTRFPRWLFCPRCRRMVKWQTGMEKRGVAPRCPHNKDHGKLVPMRFVAVCGNGHLDDVDWKRWAHSSSRNNRERGQCQAADLRFRNVPNVGGGLRSLEVTCGTCGAGRNLENLTSAFALRQIGQACPGRQPWQTQEDARSCDKPLVALQRGAASVYFPEVVSAIDIPPESSWAFVNDPQHRLRRHSDFRSIVARPDHPLRDALTDVIARDTGLTRSEIDRAVAVELGEAARPQQSESAESIVRDEWTALCHPLENEDPRDYFITRSAERPEPRGADGRALTLMNSMVPHVVLVDRLREARVLRGFKRHTMEDEISANLERHGEYLPAVVVFGEGFFLQFEEAALAEWEQRPEVRRRCARLATRRQNRATWLPTPTPRYVLLHTFAHLLLRNTAFDAGYSTSALRERLYVNQNDDDPPMAGILVYTAAGDSEGTLGGLVRMGEYKRFARLFLASVASARWCSFDPVCVESPGQGPGALSLAACHACSLVPETSCVGGNRLLDRRLLVDETYGFFRDLIDVLGQSTGGDAC